MGETYKAQRSNRGKTPSVRRTKMLTDKEIKGAKKVCRALLGAITTIDSGCSYCIESFIDTANEDLRDAGVPFKFEMIDSWDCVVEVKKC